MPLIEDLHDCETDQERAVWLLGAPFVVLLTETMAIRAALHAARFKPGLDYLDSEIQHLNRPRNPRANYEPMAILAARGDLRRIAVGAAS